MKWIVGKYRYERRQEYGADGSIGDGRYYQGGRGKSTDFRCEKSRPKSGRSQGQSQGISFAIILFP